MQLPPIDYNTYIKVAPEHVYEALTTGEIWDSWFTQGTKVDPRPGGFIRFKWVNFKVDRYTTEAECPVLEAEPPRRFVFKWQAGDSWTTIEFDLEARGEGTILRVKESGHTDSEKDLAALVDCASGWGEAITLLKFYLEHGVTFGEVPEE